MGAAAVDSLTRLPDAGFAHPERLWLALPIALVLLLAPWVRRRRASALPLLLRGLLLLSVVAVLLEPVSRSERRQDGRLIVLADVSPSMGAAGVAEVKRRVEAAPGHELIAVGATAEPLDGPAALRPDPRRHTDLAAALRLAAARAPADRPTRVVLLSDGRATADGAEEAARRLRTDRIGLWAAALPREAPPAKPAVTIAGITLPPVRDRGEPFAVRATLRSDGPVNARAVLYVDGKEMAARDVTPAAGEQEIVFDPITLPPGKHLAQVVVDDAEAGEELIVAGTPRVLFLAGKPRRVRIADALSVQGMEVEVRSASEPGSFDGFDAIVLLPDAPGAELEKHSAALAEFVGRRGGGLLAVGGTEGPGLARLHATPTAHLLPLDVPARTKPKPKPETPVRKPEPKIEVVEEETEAFPISVCLVVDRSGSMRGRKMRQAKAAAAAAAEALTEADRISVVAFGDTVVVPLASRVAGDPGFVLRALAGLSAEGKTAMFAALEAGYAILKKEQAPIRHLVLISDGIPTDDGPWKNTITAMAKEKITLSAVGIGFDIDTHLLGSFARWGRGKYWLANHPHKVPQVVTQDTRRIVAARDRRGKDAERNRPDANKPEEEPEKPEPKPEPPKPPPMLRMVADPGAPREMLKGIRDEDLPSVAGVEEGKLRFAAWSAVRAGEGGPALVAYGRVGLGTAAVLSVDPEAPGARALSEHAEFPRLMAQLVRSLFPDGGGEPVLVKHERAGETLRFLVLGEDGLPRTDLPLEVTLDGRPLAVVRRAGRFEVALPRRDAPARAAWKVGDLASGGLAVPASVDRELRARGADRATLLRLTGSAARLDRDDALTVPRRKIPTEQPATLPFLLMAAILLPLDAWVRRRASR